MRILKESVQLSLSDLPGTVSVDGELLKGCIQKTNTYLQLITAKCNELDIKIFESLGQRNISGFIGEVFANTVAQIANNAKAIEAVRIEYESKLFWYQHRENPVPELVIFIDKNGGMRGLRKLVADTTDEQGNPTVVKPASVPTKQQAQKAQTAKLKNKLSTDVQTLIEKEKKARLTTSGDTIDMGEVATNDWGF